MIQSSVILTAMLALPQFARDSLSDSERRALLEPVALAIASTARTPEEAAFLIVQGWQESRWALAVLTDHCDQMPRGMQCDPDRHGVPRAHGPWQVWTQYARTTSLAGEARFVLNQGLLGKARCASWEGAFSALHSTSTRNWPGAPRRVQTMRAVLAGWGMR